MPKFLCCFLFVATTFAEGWVRPGPATNALVWGRSEGLLFAVPPAGFRAPEPRGLIRLGYPVHKDGRHDLVNFIAIEPVVKGRKGFSELEKSKLDGKPGKRLTVLDAGTVSKVGGGVEELRVKLAVEKFENGAEVEIEIRQRSDAPDEILLITQATTNSARMESCILTATMGNMIRARELWLSDEVATSHKLYPSYTDIHFAPHSIFSSKHLKRLDGGDLIAAITTDEEEPAVTQPFPKSNFWHYTGSRVMQYWKKPAHDVRDRLSVVVNARYTYWGSRQPIPHGIAFENFEMREPFRNGQQFIFGITRRSPAELGFQRKNQ